MKASPLMRAWLRRLAAAGVEFRLRRRWLGWDEEGRLEFDSPDGRESVATAATVFCLGGASWPRLGSTGDWVTPLTGAGIAVSPLKPSNCGFLAPWSPAFRCRFEGQPLKRVALSFRGRSARGEVVITAAGLEGGAIYALSASLRDAIDAEGAAELTIDLLPDMPSATLEAASAGRAASNRSRRSCARPRACLPSQSVSCRRPH